MGWDTCASPKSLTTSASGKWACVMDQAPWLKKMEPYIRVHGLTTIRRAKAYKNTQIVPFMKVNGMQICTTAAARRRSRTNRAMLEASSMERNLVKVC